MRCVTGKRCATAQVLTVLGQEPIPMRACGEMRVEVRSVRIEAADGDDRWRAWKIEGCRYFCGAALQNYTPLRLPRVTGSDQPPRKDGAMRGHILQ